jgi:hypothetical protein
VNEDQIIQFGERAKALLQSDTFVEAISALMNSHLEALLATHDDDADGREKHFRQLRCYEAVLADLKQRAQAADELIAAQQQPVDDDEEF